MNTEIISFIIAPVVTAFVTWFFTRRKNNAEAKHSELDNVEKAVSIWQQLSENLEKRLNAEICLLRKENADLRDSLLKISYENEDLRRKMKALDGENRKLLEELKRFNNRNQ